MAIKLEFNQPKTRYEDRRVLLDGRCIGKRRARMHKHPDRLTTMHHN